MKAPAQGVGNRVQGWVVKVLGDHVAKAGNEIQISGFPVPLCQPRKDAEDTKVALHPKDGAAGVQFLAINRR